MRPLAALLLTAYLSAATVPSKPKQKPRTTPSQVRVWMQNLSLREQVAQLVIIPFFGDAPSSRSKEFRTFNRLVRQSGVGGLIVLNRVRNGIAISAEPYAMASFINRMQRVAPIPLIVGGDFERGVSMRVSDTVKFPYNMAFAAAKDVDGSRFMGFYTAKEARALGVHWVFAPDADVNNNADNPVIGLRSFSENPDEVAEHVKAYIEGAHADPSNIVLLSAKHFPGQGDTAIDTHLGLGNVAGDRARLDAVELKPFRAAIAAGVDSIMMAHLTVPAIESESIPATVSSKLVTGLLKKELGFDGIVVTDAMDMFGLSKQFTPGEAAVRAIEAGVDVLLMPPDVDKAIAGVVKAVESGRISRERIRQSVEKVLAAKVRLGLHRKRLVNVEEIAEVIDSPEAAARAQQTADRALTLIRNGNNIFPLKSKETSCLYVVNENRHSQLGRRLIDEAKDRAPKMPAQWLDSSIADSTLNEIATSSKSCSAIIVATFASATANRGDAGLGLLPNLTRFVDALIAGPSPVGLISFGNPYMLRNFPKVDAYVAAFSTAATSEVAMGKALFGEIPFRGKLVVSIPGLAEYGSGITQ